jgi:hypothetical protein
MEWDDLLQWRSMRLADGHAYGDAHTDGDANSDWDAFAYAHLHTGGHARAVEHSFTVSDPGCSLWVCPDGYAFVCVRRGVQRHAPERGQPPEPGHGNVGIACADALYQ